MLQLHMKTSTMRTATGQDISRRPDGSWRSPIHKMKECHWHSPLSKIKSAARKVVQKASSLVKKGTDLVVKGAKETTNKTGVARNFEKTGEYEKTLEDFDALKPSNVKNIQTQYGSGKVGTLSDGTKVVARPGSKTGGPTLEIKISNSIIYKIRY